MTCRHLPTPRPDEKAVVVIEILAPQVSADSDDFKVFDRRFTDFKQAVDTLIAQHFSGALKMKVVMKKDHQFGSMW